MQLLNKHRLVSQSNRNLLNVFKDFNLTPISPFREAELSVVKVQLHITRELLRESGKRVYVYPNHHLVPKTEPWPKPEPNQDSGLKIKSAVSKNTPTHSELLLLRQPTSQSRLSDSRRGLLPTDFSQEGKLGELLPQAQEHCGGFGMHRFGSRETRGGQMEQ